ncbi:GT4 family glycosyltransferase PelF [Exiguobacterium sp. AM39-5BH]|uniref:GT4 family glycosyltransferase PelF n=2 Tax=unclassified Exiguobacterium TaxID=2644629 RepID=UPI002100FB9A|nr:GT4 family glycosyltransferase PelF [Exiguobacterium sp. AM39-5BH]
MIYAAKILQERHRLFKLTIMGPLDEDEDYAEECRLLIEQSGLTDYVELVGKVDVQAYLPTFDLLLLTSISEGQPLAILEGMAAGIPWVATDVGACSELLYGRADDPFGPAGFIVPPVHPEAVADKVEWMMDYPQERMRFGKNGRERVRQYYRLQQVVDRYKAIYETRREQYGGHRV